MKLYHGTDYEFNKFSSSYLGNNTQWDNCNRGFHLSPELGMAQLFGNIILECNIDVIKPLNIVDIFNTPSQASDIVKIIFNEDISDAKEALSFLDENIGLGEILEFKEAFNDTEVLNDFINLGYDHIIDTFSKDKIEYCIFNAENISIINKITSQSFNTDDLLKVIPINSFQKTNALKALSSNDSYQIDILQKQIKNNISSIPDNIDGHEITTLKKIKILAGVDNEYGSLSYSVQDGILYRHLEGRLTTVSPVLKSSTIINNIKSYKMSM